MSNLPTHLPLTVNQMIEELDNLNPPVVLTAIVNETDLCTIAYKVGRRSIVDELLRLKESQNDGR